MISEINSSDMTPLSGLTRHPEIAFVDAEHAHFRYQDDECEHLFKALKTDTPDVSRAYLAVNFWRQLIWQPIYLNVASSYQYRVNVEVDQLSQRRIEHRLYGVHVATFTHYETQDLAVEASLKQLKLFFSERHLDLQQCCHLSKGLSDRIASDIIANALLSVSGLERQILLHEALACWQTTLFNKTPTTFVNQENQLRVKLSSCCLHLEINPNSPCFSCPKNTSRRK
ncbi:hypothetical protein CS022_06475 [Veronia nyctiphanis]|uniref:Ferric siderophore reductase C-terminal domain-containing protein n=1 Tax=Veronia nyctiphanis TaxID=1278244 RepID=A0A4Q0YS21_9GAMM|nr:hypothetical protein [Veronia nyctiphanis]RXJ73926.1 hypothetical protein CS022_06475 [Veronia nyctiphanis]